MIFKTLTTAAISICMVSFAQAKELGYKTIGNPNASQGGTFTYSILDEPTSLNPITYTDTYSRWIL